MGDFNFALLRDCLSFFLIRPAFCTIIWSAHQYQMLAGVCPSRKPGHGMSEVAGSRRIVHASPRGSPHAAPVSGLT